MKISNVYNLPEELVNAIDTERHSPVGHYSATTLLKGVKEIILTDNHFDDITIDASDCVNTLLGTAVHALFSNPDNKNTEQDIEYQLSESATICGRMDYFNADTNELKDYKTTSLYKIKTQDFSDWKKQLLIYCWLIRKAWHKTVSKCTIIALIKDWSKSQIAVSKTPIYQWEFVPTESDLKDIETFIQNKVSDILIAKTMDEGKVKPCKPEERWNTGTTYAFVGKGKKRATMVTANKEDADRYEIEHPELVKEIRVGEDKKCLLYCECKNFCSHYQELLKEYEEVNTKDVEDL